MLSTNHIAHELTITSSKPNAIHISKIIRAFPSKLDELISVVCGSDYILSQRASHALIHTIDGKNITLNREQLILLIDNFDRTDQHHGVTRNVLRALHSIKEYPEEKNAQLLDFCLNKINNPNYPIAVQVFSIDVAYTISKPYPELLRELYYTLSASEESESVGLKSRTKKYLNRIRKDIEL